MLKNLRFLTPKFRIILVFFLISIANTKTFSQTLPLTADYTNLILQKVTSCLIYPAQAIKKGWKGITKVKFTLTHDGQVKEINIAESSGYPLLDAAAILAIKDASPYPFPSNYQNQRELEIILPINYSQEFLEATSNLSPEQFIEQPAPDEIDNDTNEEPPESTEETKILPPLLTPTITPEPSIEKLIVPPDEEISAFPQALLITSDYADLIIQKVASHLIYPTQAIREKWNGITKVKFTLNQDGRVKEVNITESSGYPLLDAAAILAIKDASPYPFPDNYQNQQGLGIILPINYSQKFSEAISNFPPEELAKQPIPTETTDINTPLSPIIPIPEPLSKPIEKTETLQLFSPQPITSKPYLEELKMIPSSPDIEKLILPQNSELRNFIEIALANHQPTQVAQKEIEMAEIKIKEALRNLFPGVKLSAYDTNGEDHKVDYKERETKVQLNQPIYYGGQLIDTLKQAKINLQVTQKNYDRQRLDVLQKTETSYYNLIAAKMHLKEKQALLQEAEEILRKIEKLSMAKLIIPLEAAGAKTWYERIQFQIDGIKQDMHMAELTFQQVLNIKESPEIKGTISRVKKLDLNFNHCLEVALNNRPEIYLSQLMVKFNEYGKKIETDKNKFTIDLTSSYGEYAGDYKTEKMRKSENWYIGIKATKPLGSSTLTTTASKDKSERKFGQTSPTKASTVNAEFSLMDNLKRYSESKKADIELTRSVSDFNEASKTVAFEIQDAFLNYQKAVLQLNTAELEMKFRRTETDVTKMRAMAGETELSNALQSLYSLSEAQSNYIQALANYYISIANIKKASGYALDI